MASAASLKPEEDDAFGDSSSRTSPGGVKRRHRFSVEWLSSLSCSGPLAAVEGASMESSRPGPAPAPRLGSSEADNSPSSPSPISGSSPDIILHMSTASVAVSVATCRATALAGASAVSEVARSLDIAALLGASASPPASQRTSAETSAAVGAELIAAKLLPPPPAGGGADSRASACGSTLCGAAAIQISFGSVLGSCACSASSTRLAVREEPIFTTKSCGCPHVAAQSPWNLASSIS
mmetsp:Transcript_33889/g.97428  ORF Transcript_33889/g.97428 Transcript_33889/m.97428 type:complete len:238 (+) Transcript_33889:192-905(+)